jgi:hypothetical protein
MAYSESLAARVRHELASRRGISEKKLFGAVGFLLRGNLLVGIWKHSLIVRLGAEAAEQALREPHVREFDVTGKPMKGWCLIDPEGVDEDEQLRRWIDAAWRFVAELPAK